MLTYTTQHCPVCDATYVKATGNLYHSEDNYSHLTDYPINHPSCSCTVQYYDFSKPLPVPPNTLIIWREQLL